VRGAQAGQLDRVPGEGESGLGGETHGPVAITLAAAIALVTVWIGIAASYHTNWPLGFYVGVIAAGFFLAGSGCTAIRRRRPARQPEPVLAPAL